MTRYADRQALADKVYWEGGIESFVFEYGIGPEDAPEGDTELQAALILLNDEMPRIREAINRLANLLPGVEEY